MRMSIGLLGVALLAACSGSRQAQQPVIGAPAEERIETPVAEEESAVQLPDPLSLLVRDVAIPEPEWTLPEYDAATNLPEVFQRIASDDTSEGALTPGWRVQIRALQSLSQASEAVLQAEEKLEEQVYMEFDAPRYKIRVGDCITRQQANDLLDRAKRAGYRDAWIIPTDVVLAEARKLWQGFELEQITPAEPDSLPTPGN